MVTLNMYGKENLDYVFVLNVPVFYKVNLLNELCLKKNIFVVFLSSGTNEIRSSDFSNSKIKFDYVILSPKTLQERPTVCNIFKLVKIVFRLSYNELVIGGWDHLEYLILESNIYDQVNNSIFSRFIKKLILSSLKRVIVPGDLNKKYIRKLNSRCTIDCMGSVGILNATFKDINVDKFVMKGKIKKYILVSRLTNIKNISFIFKYFELNPNEFLDIIGTGEDINYLMQISPSNVNFLGSITNQEVLTLIPQYYALILPSLKEPWGLVVDESISSGIPVVCSDRAGASELVNKYKVGFLFSPIDFLSFLNAMNLLHLNYETTKENTLKLSKNFNKIVNPLSVFL
jgi:glycosyltransferase involved in cell wall biosynthesis